MAPPDLLGEGGLGGADSYYRLFEQDLARVKRGSLQVSWLSLSAQWSRTLTSDAWPFSQRKTTRHWSLLQIEWQPLLSLTASPPSAAI